MQRVCDVVLVLRNILDLHIHFMHKAKFIDYDLRMFRTALNLVYFDSYNFIRFEFESTHKAV